MENELYYRGSGTYETAVQNQLSRLQNSNVMLRNSIRDMEYGIRSDIRKSTYAIVASQAMLAETFQHGFNSINNTLEIGFDRMSAQMSDIADAISAMSDKICSKLDEIHDIVNNPLLTQSRELYRRALTNFEKGYYEEALEDIKAAVEKNRTDFISWNLLGQIYLFGAGKFSNVINLDEAENAFFNAAKYIDADIGQSEEADKLASEIYYYLGYTRLVKSNDMLVESKIDESNKKLIEAESASGRAYQISKENILAGYEQAKELHFLGKDDEALKIIEAIIRAEPTFALKASNDKNFESMWDKIDALIEKLRDEVAEKARERCRKNRMVIENVIEKLKNKIESISYPSLDAVNEMNSYYENINSYGKHSNFRLNMRRAAIDLKYLESVNSKALEYIVESTGDLPYFEDSLKTGLSGKAPLQKHLNNLIAEIQTFQNECENGIGKDYFGVRKNYEKLLTVDIYRYLTETTKSLEAKIKNKIENLEYLEIYLKVFSKAGYKPLTKAEKKRNAIGGSIGFVVGLVAGLLLGRFLFNLFLNSPDAKDYVTGALALIGAVGGFFVAGVIGAIGGLIILGLIGLGLGKIFTAFLFSFSLPLLGYIPISVGSAILTVLVALVFCCLGMVTLEKKNK